MAKRLFVLYAIIELAVIVALTSTIGFGWVNLRNGGSGRHDLWDWPYDVEQPIAPAIAEWADAVASGISGQSRLSRREDVVQEPAGPAGAEDPETIVLRQQRGFRRARQADTVVAALVGACDGELPVGPLLDAIASSVLPHGAADVEHARAPSSAPA